MNTTRINYVAVGVFVAAALLGIVAAVALLTGRTGATDTYFAVYKNVTGVKFGTQVLYEGYPIGQVETVSPEVAGGSMKFKVEFQVLQGWRIPDDSIARIGASGLLSAITVNIDAGKSPIAHKPGQQIAGREAADLFSAVSGVAGQLSTITQNDIRPLLAAMQKAIGNFAVSVKMVNGLLTGDGAHMIKTFAGVADDLRALTRDLNERLPRIADNVNNSATNFAALAKSLKGTRQKLDELLVQSNALVDENRVQVRRSIENLQSVSESLARRIDSINQNVAGTARNLYEFSREIRQNPGLLLSGSHSRDKALP